MNVLLLSPYPERLQDALAAAGDCVRATNRPITAAALADEAVEFVVCYGYRHLIEADVIERWPARIINLHISLLPWNRGSDPNFWSFFDDTPKGVSVHQVDPGLDTGGLLAQALILFGRNETLASSYDQLRDAVETLFARTWPAIRRGLQPGRPQRGKGSYHRRRDAEPFLADLPDGWATPVEIVEEMGRRHRERRPALVAAAGR
jgi:methionyl-tRNA formyltransferase